MHIPASPDSAKPSSAPALIHTNFLLPGLVLPLLIAPVPDATEAGAFQPFLNLMLNFQRSKIKLFFLKRLILFIHMHVCTYRNLQNPEGTLNPLELNFRAVVSYLTLVLGTKLGSFRRAASALNADPSLQILDCFPVGNGRVSP